MSETPERDDLESPVDRRRNELRTSRLADGIWLVASRPSRATEPDRRLEGRSRSDATEV
ncbi:hypothetical protein QA600_16975 [Natronococcus sp. A-GB1]|uniref:hypothetical protein n=1 Tax=Natronococcus sp. A-GB1 TaxID=3037648 RepID=UPI00241C40AD|nr:hypothetical protein [Natronococcus sp. A-GB1]MDG5761028.1 hypothetical protein [Natronococcus sp. A-GB1]